MLESLEYYAWYLVFFFCLKGKMMIPIVSWNREIFDGFLSDGRYFTVYKFLINDLARQAILYSYEAYKNPCIGRFTRF